MTIEKFDVRSVAIPHKFLLAFPLKFQSG